MTRRRPLWERLQPRPAAVAAEAAPTGDDASSSDAVALARARPPRPRRAELAGDGVAAEAESFGGLLAMAAGQFQRGFEQGLVEQRAGLGRDLGAAGLELAAGPAAQRGGSFAVAGWCRDCQPFQ